MSARRKRLPNPPEPDVSAWSFRRGERLLMLIVALTVLTGYGLILMGAPHPGDPLGLYDMLPAAAFVLCLAFSHAVFVIAGSRCDTRLPAIAFLLSGLGLMVQIRLRSYDVRAVDDLSTYAFPLGVAMMLACLLLFRRGRWKLLHWSRWPCYALTLLVLGGMLAWGQRFRGGLYLPGQVNPTEVIKVLLVVFTAGVMAARLRPTKKKKGGDTPKLSLSVCVSLVVAWAVPLALLVAARDLGMVLILAAVLGAMLWMASGRPLLMLAAGAGALVAGAAAGLTIPHASRRFAAWRDPFDDPTGTGWQLLQGLTGLYNGGLWGRGIGEGAPQLIPVASSDFVYVAAGEEIGFIGCVLLVMLFVVLFLRGFRIAADTTELFPGLLAGGLTAALAVQTLVNIGGVTKALPMTGVTLPFVSYGGSSLVTTWIMIGLILAASDEVSSPAT